MRTTGLVLTVIVFAGMKSPRGSFSLEHLSVRNWEELRICGMWRDLSQLWKTEMHPISGISRAPLAKLWQGVDIETPVSNYSL